jgi:hypothetical protein
MRNTWNLIKTRTDFNGVNRYSDGADEPGASLLFPVREDILVFFIALVPSPVTHASLPVLWA